MTSASVPWLVYTPAIAASVPAAAASPSAAPSGRFAGALGLRALLDDSDVDQFVHHWLRIGLDRIVSPIEFLSFSADVVMDRIELRPIPGIRFDGGSVAAFIIGSCFYHGAFHIFVAVPSSTYPGSDHMVYRCSVYSAYRDIPAPPPPPPGSPHRSSSGSGD